MAECHTFWEFIRLKIKEIEMAERLQSDYRGGGGMALAKITRQGLVSIAILVAVLWGCILSERYLSRNSRMETYRALRDMRYLKFKRRVEPASRPVAPPGAPSRSMGPVVG